MTDMGKNVTKIAIAALGIVTMVLTLVIAPLVKANASNTAILERLKEVEVNTRRLESVPEKVAALTEATAGLRSDVGRLEKKIDSHIDREK